MGIAGENEFPSLKLACEYNSELNLSLKCQMFTCENKAPYKVNNKDYHTLYFTTWPQQQVTGLLPPAGVQVGCCCLAVRAQKGQG